MAHFKKLHVRAERTCSYVITRSHSSLKLLLVNMHFFQKPQIFRLTCAHLNNLVGTKEVFEWQVSSNQSNFNWFGNSFFFMNFNYRTRAIITRSLYFFTPFFTAVFIVERLLLQTAYVLNNGNSSFFESKIRGL